MSLFIAFVALLSGLVFAGTPEILNAFMQKGNMKLVRASKIGSGLVEYVFENKQMPYSSKRFLVVYATEDGKYVLMGALVDGVSGKNLTRERYRELTRIDISSLPLEEALRFTYGKGGKKLIMFSDPDCPFCRKTHEWLKRKNVELYVFLYPLPIHPQAYKKSVSILCSGDRERAYDEALSGKKVRVRECKKGESLLKKHMLTGQLVGVGGTPLLITEKGYRIEGFNLKELAGYLGGRKDEK